MIWLSIAGMPRTKKTSDEFGMVPTKGGGKRLVKFPARAWRDWCATAPIRFREPRPREPLTQLLNCRAIFYLSNRQRGDAVGYYQGLADFLERRGIPGAPERGLVLNDRQIVSWDGSRIRRDNVEPRVEVELTQLEEETT